MAKPEQGLIELADRPGALQQCRNVKMANSAHAYVRGNTLKFYEWLEAADIGKIPAGAAHLDLRRLSCWESRPFSRYRRQDPY